MLPTCPTCKQTDQIQKVTGVYSANTKEWKESSTGIDAWGNTVTTEELRKAHTSLGIKLKLPDEPARPTHPGLWYGIGVIVLLFLCSILCPIALVPLSFILPLLGGSAFLPDIAGLPAWAVTALVIGFPMLCLGGLGLGVLAWLGVKVKKRFGDDMSRYRQKMAVFERDELPRWQSAKARWEQLYYCARDETIFIPGEGQAIKADDMERYLYNPFFRS